MSFNILVVDDTKFMRKMLTDILKQYGYEVVGEAENGRQAVQRYEELRPDVVLMDITMPEMDGIDAMKEIRRIDSDAVVLICSAMSQQDLISDALKAGANGYVMKPFKPNRVNEIIRKYGFPRASNNPVPQVVEAPQEPVLQQVAAAVETVERVDVGEHAEQAAETSSVLLAGSSEEAALLQPPADEPQELELMQEQESQQEEEPLELMQEQEPQQEEELLELVQEVEPQQEEEPLELVQEQEPQHEEEPLELVQEQEPQQEEEPLELVQEVERQQEEEPLELVQEVEQQEEEPLELVQEQEPQQEEEPLELVQEVEPQQEEEPLELVQEQEPLELVQDLDETGENILPMSILEQPSLDELPSSDVDMELSLEQLNDLTLEMREIPAVVSETVGAAAVIADPEPNPEQEVESAVSTSRTMQEYGDSGKRGFKALEGGKIINLFRGNEPMKNFTSSFMCNWNEEVNGEMSQFVVICTEAENKIAIEVTGNGNQKQSIHLSIDGFNQLGAWLQDKLGNAPVNVRELSKRADF
jgi:CheY-like chemotaxis protein